MNVLATFKGESVKIVDIDVNGSAVYIIYIDSSDILKRALIYSPGNSDNLAIGASIPANKVRLDNVFYVAKNGSDMNTGTMEDPFLSIQAGIDYILDLDILDPSTGKFAVLKVSPGTYIEQIHSVQGLFIDGQTHNVTTSEAQPVILYNTGVDSDHWPLRGEVGDHFYMGNIHIKTDAGKIFGPIGNNRFNSIKFEGGYFIERDEDIQLYTVYKDCAFIWSKAFELLGVATQGRYMVFEQCWFGWWQTMRFESTHTAGNAVLDMDGGHLAFTQLMLKGDWYHFAKNVHSFGAYRHEYDTTKGVSYRNVTVSNGLHFFSEPMHFQMINCGMTDAAEMPLPADQPDITSDVIISKCTFINCSMYNGLCGCVQIQNPEKNVGGDTTNKYFDLEAAVTSIPASGRGTIHVHEDLEDLPELVLNSKSNVAIEGGKQYEMSFTGKICEVGPDQELHFHNIEYMDGGDIEVNGNDALLCFESCSTAECNIVATSGADSYIHINKTNILSTSAGPCLEVNNIDTYLMVSYSRLKGGTGQPAINFNVEADHRAKAKFSTFIHGDDGNENPIVRTGTFTVYVAIYNCAGNATLVPTGITNTISSANITYDDHITF